MFLKISNSDNSKTSGQKMRVEPSLKVKLSNGKVHVLSRDIVRREEGREDILLEMFPVDKMS